MNKIAAIVVLYNPDENVISNIKSYQNQVDMIFAIDNSEMSNSFILSNIHSINNLEYVPNKCNLGIAAALNIGAEKAISKGFSYVLTLDQDSEATPDMVSNLLACFTQADNIALVAPIIQHYKGKNIEPARIKPCKQIITAWTSGSLVDLNAWQIVEGYNEDFFIDYADHEFCLKLNELRFKIYACNNSILKHRLGNIEEINLVFRKVYTTNHSPLRLYYRFRNRFQLKHKYKSVFPEFFKIDDKEFWKSFLKIILFEKQRLKKLKMMFKGYKDFSNNISGKLNISN